jgi:hypothetical protein
MVITFFQEKRVGGGELNYNARTRRRKEKITTNKNKKRKKKRVSKRLAFRFKKIKSFQKEREINRTDGHQK